MLFESEDAEQEGDDERDLGVCNYILNMSPDCHYASIRKARALVRLGKRVEALEEFSKIPLSDETHQPFLIAQLQRSDILISLDRRVEALETLESLRLLELSAEDVSRIQFRLGNLLLEMGKPEESLGAFESAYRTSPDLHRDNFLHTHKAKALKQLGRLEEAALEIDNDLQNFPLNYGILRQKVAMLHELGQHQQALSEVERFLNHQPHADHHAMALFDLGSLLYSQNRLSEAISAWERVGSLVPDDNIQLMIHMVRNVHDNKNGRLL